MHCMVASATYMHHVVQHSISKYCDVKGSSRQAGFCMAPGGARGCAVIGVTISIRDEALASQMAQVVLQSSGLHIVSDMASDMADVSGWPKADVALVDYPVDTSLPVVLVTLEPQAGDVVTVRPSCRPAELVAAFERALGSHRLAAGGCQIAVWAPKGGVGASAFGMNLAAAISDMGLSVAYADLDYVWGDGVSWFDSQMHRSGGAAASGSGSRLVHPCGLRGFVAASAQEAAYLPESLRSGFDLSVLDCPSGIRPGVLVDELYVVVGCDLASLRRARMALDSWLQDCANINPVAVLRHGSQLTPEDVDNVLGVTAVAVLVHEPQLTSWVDRGKLIYPLRKSRWGREVRALADRLASEIAPAPTRHVQTAVGGDALGTLADRLRGRI